MKKLNLYILLLVLIFSTNNKSYSEPVTERLLNYSVALGLGYQSTMYYTDSSSASQNMLTLNTSAAYFPCSFFSLNLFFEIGIKSYFNASGIPTAEQVYFATSINRINFNTGLSFDFLLPLNSFTILYLGVAPTYMYNDTANKDDNTDIDSYYRGSSENDFLLKISFGAKFALFTSILMDIQTYIMLPLHKENSWLNTGSKQYKEMVLGFSVSLGYFN